ncbi:MAG: TetR family transcriptional regulator [Oscillochloris sp.]|nr:TetR family transcriptional regulator [Oscillochloris sp.]
MAKRRAQQKALTANRLFAAALRLFREHGFEATTVEQITRAAGVAKGTFFTHFASKDAILDHIGQFQMERIGAALAADPTFAQLPLRAQLRTIFRTLAGGLTQQPAEMRALNIEIIARRSLFDIDPDGIGKLDRLIEELVAAGQAHGHIRSDAPVARIAVLIRSSYFLAVFEWLRNDSLDLVELAYQHLDLVLEGLATHMHDQE